MTTDISLNYQLWLGRISVRTYNALGRAGLITTDDVCRFVAKGGNLGRIKKLGKTSLEEVNSQLEVWKRDMDRREAEAEQQRKAALSDEERAEEEQQRRRMEQERARIEAERQQKLWEKTHPLCRLSAQLQAYIQRQYLVLAKEKLTVRAFHFIEKYLPEVEQTMLMMDKPREQFATICPDSSPKKTLDDIHAFCALLKERLNEWTLFGEERLALSCCAEQFPFLTEEQCALVCRFREDMGYTPFLYIVYSYLLADSSRTTLFYRQWLGLEGGKRMSLSEIGHSAGLTTERIRQLLYSYKLPEGLLVPEDYKAHRSALFTSPFITIQSPAIAEAGELQQRFFGNGQAPAEQAICGENFFVFAKMWTLVADYNVVEEGPVCVLVKRDCLEVSTVKHAIKKLLAAIDEKHYKDEPVAVTRFTGNAPEPQRQVMSSLMRRVAEEYLHLTVTDDSLVMPKNSVDVCEEMVEVLAEHGQPMTIEELAAALKERNPHAVRLSPSYIRPFLWKDARLKNLGKQGKYGLDEWKNVWFGSITDLLYAILQESEVPLSMKEIMEKVHVHYPQANRNSMNSLMMGRERKWVTRFRGNLFGLSEKTYPSSYQPDVVARTQTFEQKCQRLSQFVETHRRFPFLQATDEEERSISLWLYNVQHHFTHLSDEQYATLQQMVNNFVNMGYPQKASEAQFVAKCEAVKAFVSTRRRLLGARDNRALYNWYANTSCKQKELTGFRAQCFAELRKYILEELRPPQLFES